jgi:hypothetical protein
MSINGTLLGGADGQCARVSEIFNSPPPPSRAERYPVMSAYCGATLYPVAAGEGFLLRRLHLQIEFTRSLFIHLHYPFYLLKILGIWRLLCGMALLIPGFPRLKEWAYTLAHSSSTLARLPHTSWLATVPIGGA